jgi:hypothetical protein
MTQDDEDREHAREGQDPEKGAEGGGSKSTDRPPGAPGDDNSEAGDTDQHSSADA